MLSLLPYVSTLIGLMAISLVKKPIKVSYHPAQFGGYNHFGSEVILILVCCVILQDHKGSKDQMVLWVGFTHGNSPTSQFW